MQARRARPKVWGGRTKPRGTLLWVIRFTKIGVEHLLSARLLTRRRRARTVTNTELISFTSSGFSTFNTQRPGALASTRNRPKLRAEFFAVSDTAQTWKPRFAFTIPVFIQIESIKR